jgi:hypothetical protein
MTVSLDYQIEYIRHDVSRLEREVSKLTDEQLRMSVGVKYDLACMRAVLATLEQVQRGQTFRREG